MSLSNRQRRVSIGEFLDLAKRYALQETVGPLKGIGRWVGVGIAGATFLGVGILVLLMALLRILQTETNGVFDGNLAFIPYLIVLVVAVAIIAVAVSRIQKHGLPPRESQR